MTQIWRCTKFYTTQRHRLNGIGRTPTSQSTKNSNDNKTPKLQNSQSNLDWFVHKVHSSVVHKNTRSHCMKRCWYWPGIRETSQQTTCNQICLRLSTFMEISERFALKTRKKTSNSSKQIFCLNLSVNHLSQFCCKFPTMSYALIPGLISHDQTLTQRGSKQIKVEGVSDDLLFICRRKLIPELWYPCHVYPAADDTIRSRPAPRSSDSNHV